MTKKKYWNNLAVTLLFLLTGMLQMQAQFKNKALLQTPDSTGFYSIQITPELSGFIKTDLSDIRILDEHQKQVPFIVRNAKTVAGEFESRDPYLSNPFVTFSQRENGDGYSYVTVENPYAYHIDKIEFEVKGPKFFKRNLEVEAGSDSYQHLIEASAIDSFIVPVFNNKRWTIKIYNGDNPPLSVTALQTYQSDKQLIALLDAGKKYTLYMNDSSAKAPSYELQNFRDSIPQTVKSIAIGTIEKIRTETFKKVETSKKWLWITLAVVLAVLAFFTVRLVKDVQKKK